MIKGFIMSVSAKEIQDLRKQTGAGMMDCKNALEEAGGDIQKAKEILRIKGLDKINKKSSRETSEGLVAICFKSNKEAAIVQIKSETDFVAKNDRFKKLITDITKIAANKLIKDKEALLKTILPDSNKTVEEEINDNIVVMGENISLGKVDIVKVDNGIIASYVHNAMGENLGKIAALVAIEYDGSEDISKIGKQIAMHVVATSPLSLSINDLDHEIVEREKMVLREQALNSGKSEEVIEKMINGRMNKFYQEVVLLEQPFVMDGAVKVADLLLKSVTTSEKPRITNYKLYKIGDK